MLPDHAGAIVRAARSQERGQHRLERDRLGVVFPDGRGRASIWKARASGRTQRRSSRRDARGVTDFRRAARHVFDTSRVDNPSRAKRRARYPRDPPPSRRTLHRTEPRA
jgi:hypothetical protein